MKIYMMNVSVAALLTVASAGIAQAQTENAASQQTADRSRCGSGAKPAVPGPVGRRAGSRVGSNGPVQAMPRNRLMMPMLQAAWAATRGEAR